MVFCRTKYQQTSFRAPLVQNSGRKCISRVELWRNLSINGKLPGFEFGGFPVLRKYGALNWEFQNHGSYNLILYFSGSSCLKMTISWQLSVKSTKNMGAIPQSISFRIFPWSSYLKMTVSWQLSVKSTKTMGAIPQNIFFHIFPRALTLKWLFRESYRWNRPKPWELSFKKNPPRPKLWELLFNQNHGSYRSKRSPRGHLDEAPMEMGLP